LPKKVFFDRSPSGSPQIKPIKFGLHAKALSDLVPKLPLTLETPRTSKRFEILTSRIYNKPVSPSIIPPKHGDPSPATFDARFPEPSEFPSPIHLKRPRLKRTKTMSAFAKHNFEQKKKSFFNYIQEVAALQGKQDVPKLIKKSKKQQATQDVAMKEIDDLMTIHNSRQRL
jgi:hypothetical protein